MLQPVAPAVSAASEVQAKDIEPLSANTSPTPAPGDDSGRLAAALALEVELIERRDFPGGFPPLLTRCVGHYRAGPCVAPAEGLAAWWAGARRQVLRMIETVKKRRP
jgi:hypothetical protein